MKFKYLLSLLTLASLCARAQINFTLTSNTQFSITCAASQASVLASSNYSSPVIYSWSGASFSTAVTGPSVSIPNPGSYTVTASSGTVSTTQIFMIGVNTQSPSFVASPTLMTLGGPGMQTFTFTATSPTTNLTHFFYSPGSPIPVASGGQVSIGPVSGPGTYTHCILNNINGCITCMQVVAAYSSTGIHDNMQEPDLVFPNPNKGLFYIQTKNTLVYAEVYDVLGALVTRQVLTGITTGIDIRPHPAGMYWVKLIDDSERSHTLKIIKQGD